METVRERILQNIKTVLEGVTIDNGYSPGDEDESSMPNPFEECLLTLYLDIFFVNDENDPVPTDTYLNRLQGDIKKAILQDSTRAGNAVDTDVLGTTPFETTEAQPYAGIIMEVRVRYRHLRTDPTAKN